MADEPVTEAEFQASVTHLAKTAGWLVYHTYRSTRSPSGFPDLCMVRGQRIIFAELKTEAGKTRPEQDRWLNALGGVVRSGGPVEVYLWRPAGLQQIADILTTSR